MIKFFFIWRFYIYDICLHDTKGQGKTAKKIVYKAEMCNKKKILMRYSIYHIPYYLACNFLAGQHAV